MRKAKKITAGILSAFLLSFGCQNPKGTTSNHDADMQHEEHQGGIVTNQDTATIPEGHRVFFENIREGEIVKSPVTIRFGVKGMAVESAEKGINKNKGHHHLLVDTLTFVRAGALIPMIENKFLHFGKGETETTLALPPGKHTLSLQFGNGVHASYGVKMSKTITVTVK